MAAHKLNDKPKIGFRVDAGNITGTGHLMEVASLIKSLRKRIDFHAVGIVNEHPLCVERLSSLIEHIEIVPEVKEEDDELNILVPFLKKENIFFLVTDLLNRSPRYYRALKEEIGNTCVILDNNIHSETPASLVINFNVLQDPQFYRAFTEDGTEYLIGPLYMIMDESLLDVWKDRRSFRREVRKIFVNQGGSDPFGLTAMILRALQKLRLNQETIVVVGGALKEHHRKELDELKDSLSGNYRFLENIPQEEVFRLLSESDLAFTAAGNTLYELSFFGVPSIIISHHKAHYEVAAKFDELGAGINLGIGTGLTENAVALAAQSLLLDADRREQLSTNARRVVDGFGTGRIADAICRVLGHTQGREKETHA